MTHHNIPVVCTPDEFLRTTPQGRRRLVRRQIDLTPEMHDQNFWITLTDESETELYAGTKTAQERSLCGTAFCFAGWAAHLAGDVFVDDETVRTRDGRLVDITRRAIGLLDLPIPEDADPEMHLPRLFAPGNTHADIDRYLFQLDEGSYDDSLPRVAY